MKSSYEQKQTEMSEIDTNFLESLKKGEEKAYLRTRKWCYSYFYDYVKNDEDTKDLVSVSIEKIRKGLSTFNSSKGKGNIESNFRSWIKTINRNTYLDYRDRKKRELSFSELSAALGFDDEDSSLMEKNTGSLIDMLSSNAYDNYSFKDNPLWNIAVKEVIAVIGSVKEPRKKIALILKFIYGFKTNEIAEIMSENFDSIQSVLHRSTLELRELYIKKGIEADYLDPDSLKNTQAV
ncbi:MAG: RNA polymerase sigma factor [Nitrospirae bacterium]|nr:RNA polymerase sigma factor [Nitrospirota bacterium]